MGGRTYWDIFMESGKIEDYLNYCRGRLEFSASLMKGFQENAAEHKRADPQGTEYR